MEEGLFAPYSIGDGMKKFGTKIGQNPFLQAFFRFYQASEIDLTSIAVAYYLLISIFPLLLIVVNI